MEKDLRLVWLFARTFEEMQAVDRGRRGLTPVQVMALRFILLHEEPNLTAVAGALGISNAAATKLVDRLVGRKLVARLEGPVDRRERRLVLTEGGREALAQAIRAGVGRIEEALEEMAGEDLSALRRGLAAFLRVILRDPALVRRVCLKCGYEHVPECLGEEIYRELGGEPREI